LEVPKHGNIAQGKECFQRAAVTALFRIGESGKDDNPSKPFEELWRREEPKTIEDRDPLSLSFPGLKVNLLPSIYA
jgi:hypothetical protein